MEQRSDRPHEAPTGTVNLVGSFRTFGEYGVLYEVVGIEEDASDMAQIVVVETGEKVSYPVQQLLCDPAVYDAELQSN